MKPSGLILAALGWAVLSVARGQLPTPAERFEKTSDSLIERENAYWRRTPFDVPEQIVLEASGILPVPGKRLLVTTRRGEMWFIDGAYETPQRLHFQLFASGLHEPLGLAAAPQGGYYVAQRPEITRVVDTDGDGRADRFETIYKIPLSGSYHEFAFGPVIGPDGSLRINLNLAYLTTWRSPVPWRGWMIEVTPDGQMTPIAAGLRSPAGLTLSSKGLWIYVENQGEWVGACHATVIDKGDFLGHPESLTWSKLPGSPVKLRPKDITNFEQPISQVAQHVPGLKPPTVWLPYAIMGIAASDIREDITGGKFGPFAGQFFISDQGQSKVMRMTLERVKGVWQGACYPFREGFDCGIIRLAFGEDGSLFTGETARGWGSIGPKKLGMERLSWTGKLPFEIQQVTAEPDGFLLEFTRPVDPVSAANLSSYRISGFTYLYHSSYGSPPIGRLLCPVRRVVVAPDHLSVRLAVGCLREGYIHQVTAAGVRAAADGETLLHETAYYTLNRKPDGDRIVPLDRSEAELCAATVAATMAVATPKHPSVHPASWKKADGDRTILLGTLPGLRFDQTELRVKAGQQILLIFRNRDDMSHNFVLCAPGRGPAVGTAALTLGVDGASRDYVPDTADVLYHTALVGPEGSDRIYFAAPATPGDYDYICSFPGHFAAMKGVLHVDS